MKMHTGLDTHRNDGLLQRRVRIVLDALTDQHAILVTPFLTSWIRDVSAITEKKQKRSRLIRSKSMSAVD